jgi:uncharacterized protein YukE
MSDAFADLMLALPAQRLVPGDPDGVDQLAQAMLRFSEVFADAAHALTLLDLVWLGDAARAFQDEFDLQPAAFKTAAHAFHDVGYALGSYAIAFDSARKTAALALEIFQRGVRTAHDAHAAASAVSGGLLPTSGPLDLRREPAGLQDRLAGIEKLDAARHQLDRAGTDAARKLREVMALAPRQVTALQHATNFFATDPTSLLNQEKIDFAAGGARAAADMAILGTTLATPTPHSVLRINHLEAKLNDLEWKHGANPRSGYHTGGAIIIPTAATLGVGSLMTTGGRAGPAILGGTIRSKGLNDAEEFLLLYRGMRRGPDGAPEVGVTAKTLGARPDRDIPLTTSGGVQPRTGGMSVNESPTGMPEFRRPPSFGGSGKDLDMFAVRSDDLGGGLRYRPESDGHGFLEPAWEMSFDQYQAQLHATRDQWTEIEP